MCTALTYKNGDSYFGRNMDIGYSFNEEVVITPRNYPITYKKNKTSTKHYAMIGIACVINNYPLYADAINEKGLGVAGLNFPCYAHYNEELIEDKYNITPYEIIPWILGECASVEEAKILLNNLNVYAEPFATGLELATLHWIISDKEKSIVLESTKDGIKIYDNPVGVMTNNPKFDFHLTNLSNYINCNAIDFQKKDVLGMEVMPLGHGTGGLGLPGDTSTTSRFVKAVFAKANSHCEKTEIANISQFFHILDTVAVPRGFATVKDGVYDYTTYTTCANQNTAVFYYKTYENSQISAVDMNKENLNFSELIRYKMVLEQQINRINA